MKDLDSFAAALGSEARKYTPVQLEQLRVDIRKLAEILLAVQALKKTTNKKSGSFSTGSS